MKCARIVLAALIVTVSLTAHGVAQSRRPLSNNETPLAETRLRERLNAWTVGLAGGLTVPGLTRVEAAQTWIDRSRAIQSQRP